MAKEISKEVTDKIFDALMKDPNKRNHVLQLLLEEKSTIEKYAKEQTKLSQSPLNRGKRPGGSFESPTALFRRRALETKNKLSDSSNSSTSSPIPFQNVENTEKLPLDQLLKGVIAYVEVKRGGEDKSQGIKQMMTVMGAAVKDTFTRDVTHVVFKDGSFTTFQKAKLLKVHIVSILWLDAVRKNQYRVPEKYFSALDPDNAQLNVSLLCSEWQKDYDDIIREEMHRSVVISQSLQASQFNRKISESSKSSYHTDDHSNKSSFVINFEVPANLNKDNDRKLTELSPPELTSDDSDCGVVDSFTSRHLKEKYLQKSDSDENELTRLTGAIAKTFGSTTKENQPKTPKKTTTPKHKIKENNNCSNVAITSLNNSSSLLSRRRRKTLSELKNNQTIDENIEMSPLMISSSMSTFNLPGEPEGRITNKTHLATNMEHLKENGIATSQPKQTRKKRRSSSSSQSENDENDQKNPRKRNKIRRLYRPDDSVVIQFQKTPSSDEKERQERKKKAMKKLGNKEKQFLKNGNGFSQTIEQALQSDSDIDLNSSLNLPKSKINGKNVTHESESDDEEKKESKKVSTQKQIKARLSQSYTPRCSQRLNTRSQQSTPIIRRSSVEFQKVPKRSAKKRIDTKISSIVCTRFHKEEVIRFEKIVNIIGGFITENVVTSRTTHLVAADSRRTINLLKAIAQGCWIIKHEWLLKSYEAGHWLPEEDYELTEFSPAVQKSRLQRQAFGPSYTMDLFKDYGLIYIANNTRGPPSEDLKALVLLCKGQLTQSVRNAKIVVGMTTRYQEQICVNPSWILDSITWSKVKNPKKYLLKSLIPENIITQKSPTY